MNLFDKSFSTILENWDNQIIGRYFDGSSLFPFKNIGITFVFFIAQGIYHILNVKVIIYRKRSVTYNNIVGYTMNIPNN